MKQRFIIVIIFIVDILLYNLAYSQWSYLGLGGKTIEVLRAHNGLLYAGTNNGVFRKRIDFPDTTWTSLGLESKHTKSLLILDDSTFIASILINIMMNASDTISLYKTTDAGTHWFPYQNGFGSGDGIDEQRQVWSLDMLQSQPEIMFAVGGAVAKSTDSGTNWRRVYGDHWNVLGFNFIKIDANRPNVIWAGGGTFFFAPFLLKSTSFGESWQHVSPTNISWDDACLSIALHSSDSNIAYAGMLMGFVLKTNDGGDTWFPVLAPSEWRAFGGLALSRDTILYASGSTGEPKRLLFYRSSNEGLSWDTIAHTNKLINGVKELLVLQNEGVDNIFFGTWDDGVFSYANIITAVDDATSRTVPSVFSLRQNYPNPFNSVTIIQFSVARSSHIKINVFDMLGRSVQTIVETYLTPGQYSVKFASHSLSTGVYFYRMYADGFVDTKKFVLVR